MVAEGADSNVAYRPLPCRRSPVTGTEGVPRQTFCRPAWARAVARSRQRGVVRAMAASAPAPPTAGVRAGADRSRRRPAPRNRKDPSLRRDRPECPEQVPVHDLVCRVELRLQVYRHLRPRHHYAVIASVPGVRCRLDPLAHGVLRPIEGRVVATLVQTFCNCLTSASRKSSAIA